MNAKTLEDKVIEFAREAHAGQTRKFGADKDKPYFDTHVMRVARKVMSKGGGKFQIYAAYLHDVKEDTDAWGTNARYDLKLPVETIDIVNSLTKNFGENYLDFILRVMRNPDAIMVKIADIEDNLLSLQEGSMRDKYLLALHLLKTQLVMIGK